MHRLYFLNSVTIDHHLRRIAARVDLALDTAGYNAGATALDTLWAGVPMITMPGLQMVSRMGSSIQASLGTSIMVGFAVVHLCRVLGQGFDWCCSDCAQFS